MLFVMYLLMGHIFISLLNLSHISMANPPTSETHEYVTVNKPENVTSEHTFIK